MHKLWKTYVHTQNYSFIFGMEIVITCTHNYAYIRNKTHRAYCFYVATSCVSQTHTVSVALLEALAGHYLLVWYKCLLTNMYIHMNYLIDTVPLRISCFRLIRTPTGTNNTLQTLQRWPLVLWLSWPIRLSPERSRCVWYTVSLRFTLRTVFRSVCLLFPSYLLLLLIQNGFAFVRPPGHHALPNQAM